MLVVEEGERALEMEDEASGHRRQVDSGSWKRGENELSPAPPEGTQTANTSA